MRLAILAVIAAGCGGRAKPPATAPEALPGFAAARWVPARPLYVLASPSLGDAQRSARDAIDLLAFATGHDLRDAVRISTELFGVDALHPDPLAAIGVDVGGGWAVFGGELSPTLVVHLAAPAKTAAFLAHRRAAGLVARSATVDGAEVVSAALPAGLTLSWAIDRDWLWLHVALPGAPDDEGSWFAASHARHEATWTGNWAWAQRAAGTAAGVVGVLDLHGVVASALTRLPDALACAKLAEPVGKVALAIGGDDHHVSARIGVNAGPDVRSTDRLRGMILPAPSGWDATAARAAIAAQWNLDFAAVRDWLAPCLAAVGAPVALADQTGLRAARAMLLDFDPDKLEGAGAIALDVSSTAFLERQLDRIPLRKTLERARTFGPYRGYSIEIPFSVTVEYVLDRRIAIAALGAGLLARLVAPGAARPASQPAIGAPIAAIDVAPPAMSASAWETVIHALAGQGLDGSPGPITRRAVQHLMGWRDGHLAVTADGGEIVITASGTRR